MEAKTANQKSGVICFLIIVFFNQTVFARQTVLDKENGGISHNIMFLLCILFFIIGFITLILLKIKDDQKKNTSSGHHSVTPQARHRNHYGSRQHSH